MKTIKYEFLKIFTSKLFLYTLIFFIIADIIILIYTENNLKNNKVPYSAYKLLNKELKNLTEQEKEDFINQEYEKIYAINIIDNIKNLKNSDNEMLRQYSETLEKENKEIYEKYIKEYENQTYKYTGDISKENYFWKEIKKEYEETKKYKQTIKEIVEKAENLNTISIFKNSENSFSSKNIKDTAKNYEKMINTKINFIPSKGIENFTNLGIIDVFIILLIFVISTIIIFEEREKNLIILIKSTKNGRTKTMLSKIIVMFILITSITLIMYSINFIYYGINIGYGNLSNSLQSISTFIYSTLQINIWQYLILFIITKICVFCIVSLIILIISSTARNNVSTYIAFIAIFSISFLLYKIIDPISKYNIFKVINIINLIEANSMYKTYINLNLLGNIKNVLTLCIYFAIILLVTCSFANLYIFNKKTDFKIKESFILNKIKGITILKQKILKKIIYIELYKLFITNKVAIIIIIFAIFQVYNFANSNKKISFSENIYRNYMQILSGKLTKEKQNFIEMEKQKFERAELAIQNIEEKVKIGEITRETAKKYTIPYEEILSQKNIFIKILEQYEYINTHPNAEFVYDTGYKELLRVNKYAFFETDLYLIVMIIICFTEIIVIEYKTGMIKILNTTPKGKKCTIKNKIIICIFTSFIIFIISVIPEILKIKQIYGFNNITASITSISAFKMLPIKINILTFIIITYLTKLIIFINITLLILYITLKIKNTTYSILVSSSVLLIPSILNLIGLEIADTLSINRILNISQIILAQQNLYYIYLIIPIIIGFYSYHKLCNTFK